jgi:hypothetical protein
MQAKKRRPPICFVAVGQLPRRASHSTGPQRPPAGHRGRLTTAPDKLRFRRSVERLKRSLGLRRIEQPVHVYDEISHLRVVDRPLCLFSLSHMGCDVVGIDADDVQRIQVFESGVLDAFKFAPDH